MDVRAWFAASAFALVLCSAAAAQPEATSLDGRELQRPVLSAPAQADFEAKLAAARADVERDPTADHLIWLGRRTAYLGRYREAIEHFGEGVRRFPADARFLRHRGHRWITTRRFDLAVRDLAAASRLVEGQPDQVEPDGLPNARGIPTSTLQTNIYYHLGLAHYLRGDYADALEAYERCLAVSRNPDMEAATRYWLYLTQTRLGLDDQAAANLAVVDVNWDIIENDAYHQLLLLYRGDVALDAVLGPNHDALQNATAAYGVVRWHELEGRTAEAARVRDELLAGDQWAAFGYLAAEADRHRERG